ncbi:alpha-N-acetylglucosaminidase C-terminal domain-containing protein, partial [Klebsiella pneumoniae]
EDYANKEWAGMISTYYRPRLQLSSRSPALLCCRSMTFGLLSSRYHLKPRSASSGDFIWQRFMGYHQYELNG